MALSSGYWNESVTIGCATGFVNPKPSENSHFSEALLRRVLGQRRELTADDLQCCSGAGALSGDKCASKRYALTAFGPTSEPSIGAARGVGAAADGVLQILFTNGIADTDDHQALPDSKKYLK
jgi:hypothetical protein